MMGFNKPYAIDYIFWFLARFNQLVLKYLIFPTIVPLQKMDGQGTEVIFSKPSLPVGVYQVSVISEGKKATKSIFLIE